MKNSVSMHSESKSVLMYKAHPDCACTTDMPQSMNGMINIARIFFIILEFYG